MKQLLFFYFIGSLSYCREAKLQGAPGGGCLSGFLITGVMFRETKFLMSKNFVRADIVHVPCSCDRAAHDLAHISLNWNPDRSYIWIDPLLEFVTTLGACDVSKPPQK